MVFGQGFEPHAQQFADMKHDKRYTKYIRIGIELGINYLLGFSEKGHHLKKGIVHDHFNHFP